MKKVLHKRSNETQGGGAKLPSSDNLEYGEIAVNYHDGVEKLFIKNDDGEVKTFRADNQLPHVEKHENQEFVYRQAVNANEAKSLELTRIYGKTLAWNQQLWDVTSSDLAIISLGGGYTSGVINKKFPKGKYLLLANFVKPNADSTGLYIADETHINTLWIDVQHDSGPIRWVFSADYDFYLCCRFQGGPSDGQNELFWTTCMLNKQLINLSTLYGSEISGMTDTQIIDKFKNEFPGYHEYNIGTLISNDADSIETVGFNLFDEEWSVDYYYDAGTGSRIVSSGIATNKNFVKVLPNTRYYLHPTTPENSIIFIIFFNDNKEYVGYGSVPTTGGTFTTPQMTSYLAFNVGDTFVKTRNSVCINLYDEVKNGTYEPYNKKKQTLGLNSFKVKSHNLWNEEWESGKVDWYTGEEGAEPSMCRSVGYIEVTPETTYYARTSGLSKSDFIVIEYDKNKNYLGHVGGGSADSLFTTTKNTKYIRFTWVGTTYNNDICINLSSTFNGQYEPHGILTIDGGLKGNDWWCDVITDGKKIFKRSSSKTINSSDLVGYSVSSAHGVNEAFTENGFINDVEDPGWSHNYDAISSLGYNIRNIDTYWITSGEIGINSSGQLAIGDNRYMSLDEFKQLCPIEIVYRVDTPIEYELVEPIYPVVKAGTTERRVSPDTEYGLSAPMVCDMQYTMDNDYVVGEFNSKLGDIQTILQTI